MNLELSDDQKVIRETARDFLTEACPSSLVREMRDDQRGWPLGLWEKMAEMGWMGVAVPEEFGGSGGDLVDLAIILEAMGEALVPGPFFSTVVLGCRAILLAGSSDQKRMLLPQVATGKLVLAFAQMEPGNGYGFGNISMRAQKRGDCYRVSGTKLFVENAHIADYLICAVRTGEGEAAGCSLLLVDAASKGIRCAQLRTLGYDRQCEVAFDDVEVPAANLLGPAGKASRIVEAIGEAASVAKCAEMLGAMEKTLSMSVDHACQRKQFGSYIGSFQAIQHHCANMAIDVDGVRLVTYQAAWLLSQGRPASREVAMAKAWTNDAANRVTRLGHQIHGAISFCDEHDMHLHYRRVKTASVLFGDTDFHLERVAESLGVTH